MAQTNILLESGTNELEIVEFFLEEPDTTSETTDYRGYYGVNVAKVLEIIRMPKVTELPEVQHRSVLGAFNLRSHIIPLVDLNVWLGKEHAETVEAPKVIVTEFNSVTTAFMVSGVNRIHRISWEEVESPNKYVSTVSQNTITGVVKLEGRIVFLLDLEKIVADLNPALGLRLDEAVDWGSEVRYRVLIADDSALIREMLKDLMQKANFEVEAVNNGREAWDRICELKAKAEAEQRPVTDYLQVLVSDIEMPSMDGHNLCKRVKEDPALRNIPVLLFSSLITEKLRHKGIAVGADDQISKPEVTTLAHRVYDLIAERKKEGLM
ncbi:MAG: chemotaxis protein [Bilophila sp.]